MESTGTFYVDGTNLIEIDAARERGENCRSEVLEGQEGIKINSTRKRVAL